MSAERQTLNVQFCARCRRGTAIVPGGNRFQAHFPHHMISNPVFSLECKFCLLIKESIPPLDLARIRQVEEGSKEESFLTSGLMEYKGGLTEYKGAMKRSSYATIDWSFFPWSDGSDERGIKVNIGCVPHSEIPDVPLSGSVAPSLESLQNASKWISTCLKTHKHCNAYAHAAKTLPTRLLKIGHGNPPKIRLYITSPSDKGLKYVTLSHRWSKDLFGKLILREDNLTALSVGIDFHDLNLSFQDAIASTQQLGFSFLWIDALCIIQKGKDSEKDWARESARMGDIYAGSIVNLAATTAADGTEALFSKETTIHWHICPITFSLGNRSHKNLAHDTETKRIFKFVAFDKELIKQEVLRAPLNSRGWVLQERLLSLRHIHFGRTQLYWACPEAMACDVFPHGLPTQMLHNSLSLSNEFHNLVLQEQEFLETTIDKMRYRFSRSSLFKKLSGTASAVAKVNSDEPKLTDKWVKTIEHYSSCYLTRSTDKLIAIGAIAKEFQQSIGGKYFAGLWEAHLLRDLLWTCKIITGRRQTTDTYVAPTWSWASVDGFVSPRTQPFPQEVSFSTILSVDIELKHPENQYGLVENGALKIAGPLAWAVWADHTNQTDLRLVLRDRSDQEIKFDLESFDQEITAVGPFSIRAAPDVMDVNDRGIPLNISKSHGEEFILLPILKSSRFGTAFPCGFILKPAKGKAGHFERFGLCYIYGSRCEGGSKYSMSLRDEQSGIVQFGKASDVFDKGGLPEGIEYRGAGDYGKTYSLSII